MQDLEQSIRERAYHLWIADGCRDGRADTHTGWLHSAKSWRDLLEVSPV
jgi:hypothetical protein